MKALIAPHLVFPRDSHLNLIFRSIVQGYKHYEHTEQYLKETCHFPAVVASYNNKRDRLNANQCGNDNPVFLGAGRICIVDC